MANEDHGLEKEMENKWVCNDEGMGLGDSCVGSKPHREKSYDNGLRAMKKSKNGRKPVVTRKKMRIMTKKKLLKRRKEMERALYDETKNS